MLANDRAKAITIPRWPEQVAAARSNYSAPTDNKSLQEGSTKECSYAGGIFESTEGFRIKIDPLAGDELTVGNRKAFKQIYKITDLKQSDRTVSGILAQTENGWQLIDTPGSTKPRYKLTSQQPPSTKDINIAAISRLVKELEAAGKKAVPLKDSILKSADRTFRIRTIEFDPKMLKAHLSDGTHLKFNGGATVLDFVKNSSRLNASTFLNNFDIRVPPEMFELYDDVEYQRNLKAGEYTQVMDAIFRKAQSIAQGNRRAAFFVALKFTDLRERGPCGAVFGLRGRLGVPPSIFDGEVGSEFKQNRLDAPQHFFGYALMADLLGSLPAKLSSEYGKEQQYWAPALAKSFQELHGSGRDAPDAGYNAIGANPLAGILFPGESYIPTTRTRWDIENDKFYNDLGIAFGKRLKADPKLLPSAVINSPEFASRRLSLGIGRPLERNWESFDPKAEASEIYLLPPKQRKPFKYDESILSLRKKLESNPTRAFVMENLSLIRSLCLNSADFMGYRYAEGYTADLAAPFCKAYNAYGKENSAAVRKRRLERMYAWP